MHTRIPFDLYTAEGVAIYRRFMERAADLVVKHGGSLSGEHGDGQSRGELLGRMFGPELVGAFGELKDIFDPGDKMNPGKVVRPARLDEHLRLGGDWAPGHAAGPVLPLPGRRGSFAQAANRCVGVGKCRQHDTQGGAVMCPSYQVTQEEEHSTRGRARLLFEMLHGHDDSPVKDGWRVDAVHDALDLCLACKGCKTDCPANVDMATYKAEFLAHHWQGRPWRRPAFRLHPRLASAAGRAVGRLRLARVVNTAQPRPRCCTGPAPRARRASSRGRCRCSRARPAALVRPPRPRAGRASAARCCSGRTPSPTISTRTPARPRWRCWKTPAGRWRSRLNRCAAA